jgi:hypothetical protein
MSNQAFGARRTLAGALFISAVAAIVSAQGCAAVTNTTAIQCTTEQECLNLGPEFAGTTCDPATKTCVRPKEDQDLCTTNQECVDRANGQPAMCKKSTRKCVNLLTPECPVVLAQPGELVNDRTIHIGLISPSGASFCGNVCEAMERTVQLAQSEFSKQLRGLPAADGTSEPRPLVVVSCHEFSGGYEALLRMANHLAKNVEVPVVIGGVDAANDLVVETQVFNPAKVLSIIPVGTSFALGQQVNPIAPTPILWRNSLSDVLVAKATGQLVQQHLAAKALADTGETELRVAMLVERNALGQGLAKQMRENWTFNNKLAKDNPSTTFLEIDIGDFLDTVGNPAPEQKIGAAVNAIYGFKPHIIAHAYAPAAIAPTFFPLVINWPAGLYMPYHVDLLPGSFLIFTAMFPVIDLVPTLKGKVFSTDVRPPTDTAHRDEWIIKFKTAFPEFRDTPIPGFTAIVEGWYDSFYLAAYGIVANRNKPVTGANIAATLPLLNPPGQIIRTGTEDMAKAVGALGSGQGIDLQGISGDLNLDPVTGETKYDTVVACPFRDPVTNKTVAFGPSGFYTENGVGKGAPVCP